MFNIMYLSGFFNHEEPWQKSTGWYLVPENMRKSESPNPFPDINIDWLGHSGFIIRIQDRHILLDPISTKFCTSSKRLLDYQIPFECLPRIDFILISHFHFDHMDTDFLKNFNQNTTLIIPKNTKIFLATEILKKFHIIESDLNDSISINNFTVIPVISKHNGHRYHPFASDYLALGYVVERNGRTLYYSGDTGFGTHFYDIQKNYNPDIVILPIGAYKPRFILKKYHLSPLEAAHAGKIFINALLYPCHFGTYTLSFDSPEIALPEFISECYQTNVPWRLARLFQPSSN